MLRLRPFQFVLVGLAVLILPCIARSQAVITNLNVYKQTAGNPPAFFIEIIGTSLWTPERPRVLVYPSATVQEIDSTATTIHAVVKGADASFVPVEVTLSYTTGPVTKATLKTTCADEDIDRSYLYITQAQSKKKYGSTVGSYFDVVQISIVNKCSLPVLIPLAGIYVAVPPRPDIHALSLDHITSMYNNGKEFTGGRAIYFNILQAAATLGSAIEPFFGHGVTQAVSILGGGFTQGSAAIWKDLSAEQLQNLASQSFQSTEQVASNGGYLQKFVFLPKTDKNDHTLETLFNQTAKAKQALVAKGDPVPAQLSALHADIIPVITQPSVAK